VILWTASRNDGATKIMSWYTVGSYGRAAIR
jgi:hypothetical protein